MLGIRQRRQPPSPPAPSDDRRCTGTTKTGKPCSRWSRPDDDRCASHVPKREIARTGERSNSGSIVSAVATIRLDSAWRTWKLGSREWQKEAWRLYDITGQLRFVANSIANQMSRARMFVGEIDAAGEALTETDDERIAALARGPLGVGDAKAEAIRLLGINLFVAGEAYIIAEDSGSEAADRWYVVSTEQISRRGDDIVINRPALFGGGSRVVDTDNDLVIRVWTPHPANIDEPDSPTRSALPDLRELEAIRKREIAELDSRLTGAGVWFLPESLDFPRSPDNPDQTFGEELTETAGISMTDRASAQAMVPIISTVPDELIDRIQPPVTFWSELSEHLLPLKQAALRSLAQSLDAPIETIEGNSESNHWNLWLTREETILTHIEPPLARIADALTQAFLMFALEAQGVDPERFAYGFSTNSLRVRGDRSPDALNLVDRGLLIDERAVEAANYSADDIPTGEDRLRQWAWRIANENPQAALGDASVRQLIGLNGAPATATEDIQVTEQVDEDNPRELPDGDGIPEDDPSNPSASIDPGLLACCELAVLRALELAGGRLVPRRPNSAVRHELHVMAPNAPTESAANRALAGAWTHFPSVAGHLSITDVQGLELLLHKYTLALLMHRKPHATELLQDVITRALRGSRA